MRVVLLLLLSFLLQISSSQLFAGEFQINEYYNLVYKAEASVLQKDYQHALEYYQKSRQLHFSPFAIDIYNATICAAKIKDYNALSDLSALLVLKGADIRFFNKHIFHSFKETTEWKNFEAQYPALVKKRDATLDMALRKKVKELNIYLEYGDVQSNDSISTEILSLFNEYKNLNENIIGANFQDTVLYPSLYGSLIFYEYQEIGGKQISEVINHAIATGELKSEIGIQFMEMGYKASKFIYLMPYFIYKNTLYKNDYNGRLDVLSNTEEAINFRANNHLDQPENIIAKVKYNFRSDITNSQEFIFMDNPSRTASIAQPEAEFLKNTVVVDVIN